MISFDANDPFPSIDEKAALSLEARKHSKEVDEWLGFKIDEVEREIRREALHENRETWAKTDAQVFLTPYLEFRLILDFLNPPENSTLLDFGAAYCRLAFVMQRHFPTMKFLGLELVKRRVVESQRIFDLKKLKNAKIECADLAAHDFKIPNADFYFIYDFGSRTEIEQLLKKLKSEKVMGHDFKLVARGLRTRDAIESLHRQWLFKEGPLSHALARDADFAIYSTA